MTEERIREVKLEKIETLREMGSNPYPERFERSHTLAEAAALDEGVEGVRIAESLMSEAPKGNVFEGMKL